MNNRQHTLSLLQQKTLTLAPLPAFISELDELIRLDDPDINAMAKLIETDVTLTTRLLSIANSPFYGFQRQISAIQDVIVLVGLSNIKNLVLACKLMEQRGQFNIWQFIDEKAFWRHNMAVAAIAKSLAELTQNAKLKADAFTAGIIHQIGLCSLANCFPEQYQLLLSDQKPRIEAEQAYFGLNSHEAGGLLCEYWNLPQQFVDAVSHQHQPQPEQMLANLLCLASQLAPILGYGKGHNVLIDIDQTLANLAIDKHDFYTAWQTLPKQLSNMIDYDMNRSSDATDQVNNSPTSFCKTDSNRLKQAIDLLLMHHAIEQTEFNNAELIIQCHAEKFDEQGHVCDLSPFIQQVEDNIYVNWTLTRECLAQTLSSLPTHTIERVSS